MHRIDAIGIAFRTRLLLASALAGLLATGTAWACKQCNTKGEGPKKTVRGSITWEPEEWRSIVSFGIGTGRVNASATVTCFPMTASDVNDEVVSQHIVNFEIAGDPPAVTVTSEDIENIAFAMVPGAVGGAEAAVKGSGSWVYFPVTERLETNWKLVMTSKWQAECTCDLAADACVSASATDPRVYGGGSYIDHLGTPNTAIPLRAGGAAEITGLGPLPEYDGSTVLETHYRHLLRAGSNDDPNDDSGELAWELVVRQSPCGVTVTMNEHPLASIPVLVTLSKTPAQIEADAMAIIFGAEDADLFETTYANTDPGSLPFFTVVDTMETISIPCIADLNGDGVVNGADLGIVLANWGAPGTVADINGDGMVNGADLGIVLAGWGACPC